MGELFVEAFRARWTDMDFQHMRSGAFLECAEETRVRFLSEHGWPMARFLEASIAPVALEDKLTYRHELRLLDAFRVDLAVAAITPDARWMKVRSRFVRDLGDVHVATVETVLVCHDVQTRKPVVPPGALASVWLGAARTPDFEAWPEKAD